MGKVGFENLDEVVALTSQNSENGGNDVGFFTLKNDGDEAVVRFMCDSTDDFDILTVHNITLANKYRKVSCIRDPREPLENCPLCANKTPITTRFFIKLIQYNKVADPNTGNITIVPKAVIWERATSYAKTLKSYLDNYGPLSDIICKIIRHGAAGDMKTTYEIVPNLSKTIYRDEIYVKDPTLFGTFEVLGSFVMNKDYNELAQFVATGNFPANPQQNAQSPAQPSTPTAQEVNNNSYIPNPTTYQTNYTPVSQPVNNPQISSVAHKAPEVTTTFDPNRITPRSGFGSSTSQEPVQGFERPRRY